MRQEDDSRDAVMQSEMSDLYFLKKKNDELVEKWWEKRRNECCEGLNRDKLIQVGTFSSSGNFVWERERGGGSL